MVFPFSLLVSLCATTNRSRDMEEKISDLNLSLEWNRTRQDLRVYAKAGSVLKIDVLVFNSLTGFASPPALSATSEVDY